MSEEIVRIKDHAEKYRLLYKKGMIKREEAKKEINPYIDLFNEKSKKIARKWNQRPKTITFSKFVR